MGRFEPQPTAPVPERAIIVGVDMGASEWPVEESLAELARRGVGTSGLHPKPLSRLPRVDWLVTMGCGVSCPSLPCTHQEDWGLQDPMGGSPRAYQDCADAIVWHLRELGEKIARA